MTEKDFKINFIDAKFCLPSHHSGLVFHRVEKTFCLKQEFRCNESDDHNCRIIVSFYAITSFDHLLEDNGIDLDDNDVCRFQIVEDLPKNHNEKVFNDDFWDRKSYTKHLKQIIEEDDFYYCLRNVTHWIPID